jgi:hypothetical protein
MQKNIPAIATLLLAMACSDQGAKTKNQNSDSAKSPNSLADGSGSGTDKSKSAPKVIRTAFPTVKELELTQSRDNGKCESKQTHISDGNGAVGVKIEPTPECDVWEQKFAIITEDGSVTLTEKQTMKKGEHIEGSDQNSNWKLADAEKTRLKTVLGRSERCHDEPTTDTCAELYAVPFLILNPKAKDRFEIGSFVECNSQGKFCTDADLTELKAILKKPDL